MMISVVFLKIFIIRRFCYLKRYLYPDYLLPLYMDINH